MAYDARLQRVVLFGGGQSSPISITRSDLWSWDGVQWTLLQGPTSPVVNEPLMCFDPEKEVTVLFEAISHETWELDAIGWKRVLGGGASPSAGTDLAYDSLRRRFVLFGYPSGGGTTETWERRGAIWTKLAVKSAPTSPPNGSIAYDRDRDRVVMLTDTGATIETWEFDGANWYRVPTTRSPGRDVGEIAYDPLRKEVVGFSGYVNWVSNPGETWTYDGREWTRRPANDPVARVLYTMCYDPVRGGILMHGGVRTLSSSGTITMSDTNFWNGTAWTAVGGGPSRYAAKSTYDAKRSRMVLFGGRGSGAGSDTFEFGPINPAQGSAYGSGCVGSFGVPTLRTFDQTLAWLGSPLVMDLSSIGKSPTTHFPVLLLGGSRTTWGSTPLPYDLGPLGMPGCSLLTSPDLALPLVNSGGLASVSLPVPSTATLLGAMVYAQGAVTDPGANLLGITVSNGYELTIGAK